jgi:prophage regulatory protein
MKNSLPDTGFLRLNQILEFIPVCKSTFWDKVKKGDYPKPVKISDRAVAWKVEDIKELMESFSK